MLACLARSRRISSWIMPACTGLPPGLLMRTTTPAVWSLLNAARSDVITFSALASPLTSMTPFTSITAVCLAAALSPMSGMKRAASSSRNTPITASPTNLKKIAQRRARRFSSTSPDTSFSITPRSQAPGAAAPAAGKEVADTFLPALP